MQNPRSGVLPGSTGYTADGESHPGQECWRAHIAREKHDDSQHESTGTSRRGCSAPITPRRSPPPCRRGSRPNGIDVAHDDRKTRTANANQ